MAAPLADDQRIGIGFGTHDPAGTDGAAGPGDVLDQNGLTERCLHAFGDAVIDVPTPAAARVSRRRQLTLQRSDCVAGHVRLELRNVGANYPFSLPKCRPSSSFRTSYGYCSVIPRRPLPRASSAITCSGTPRQRPSDEPLRRRDELSPPPG